MNNALDNQSIVLECRDVEKYYGDGHLRVEVFKALSLTLHEGEQVAIVGPSGVGKSTLLHILGGLDKVSSGEVLLLGHSVYEMNEAERCRMRNQTLGFVYQFHHLLPEFTALENVMVPLLLGDVSVKVAEQKATDCLASVGLGMRLEHKPSQLSGGERQRVAIARALVSNPKCILADEPTGNLDNETASKIFDLFLSLNEKFNTAFIIVTHDISLAKKTERILTLSSTGLKPYEKAF